MQVVFQLWCPVYNSMIHQCQCPYKVETKISLQACGKLLERVTAYDANTDSRSVAISRLPRHSKGAGFSGLGADSRNSEQELNLRVDSTGCCESLRG